MIYVIVGAIILYFLYYACVKPYTYWRNLGVAQFSVPEIWFYTITTWIRIKPISDEIEFTYNSFPNVRYYGSYDSTRPPLNIKDPDLIKQIMVKDFDHFVDHSQMFENVDQPLWNNTLLFLKGDKWRYMRNKLSPFFTGAKLKFMFGLVSESADQFVQYFQNQKKEVIEVETRDAFTRFANDVIASTAFGITCNSMKNPDNEFYSMGTNMTTFGGDFFQVIRFFLILMFPKVAKLFGMKAFEDKPYVFFNNVIKENIKERREKGIVRPDMIHQLLESNKNKSDDTDEMSDEDIAAQAFAFFLAGFDSVATAMHFMAYELALNPEVQKRVHEEIDELRNSGLVKLSYEDLPKLKYLDQVISETNRKWPSALMVDRACVKPYTIEPIHQKEKPIHLQVGDIIQIPLFGLHRDPTYYPDPESFDPSRFDDEKAMANSFAYLPFGGGPRGCMGVRFALMEIKLVFFNLLSNFEFTVIEKTEIPLKLSKTKFQLINDEGFWVGFKLRKLKSQ